jgi:hypothetical protein
MTHVDCATITKTHRNSAPSKARPQRFRAWIRRSSGKSIVVASLGVNHESPVKRNAPGALNEKQAEYLKVSRWIKEAGSAGVTSSALKKMVNGEFDLRRLNDITQQLLESKQIEQRFASTPSGGRPSHRWFAL